MRDVRDAVAALQRRVHVGVDGRLHGRGRVHARHDGHGALRHVRNDDDYASFFAGNPVEQCQRMVADLGQPSSDAYVVPSATGLGTVCDQLVTRVRGLAGL